MKALKIIKEVISLPKRRKIALKIASKYGMTYEIKRSMRHGMTPEEALYDWDIYPIKEK